MKKYEEAERDYKDGLILSDIAEKYDVSVGTVRSWKSRHWTSNVATKTQRVAKKVAIKKATEKAIDKLNDSELTEKQKSFVLEYLRIYNATQAYINVYDCTYQTAKTNGSILLTNTNIQNEIKRLRKAKLQELSVDAFDLMEDMVIEARADIGDYIDFGKYDMLHIDSEGDVKLDTEDKPEIFHKSWAQFKDKNKIDTKPIKSIKMGKDGPVIELHDRNKARDKLLELLKSDSSNTKIEITQFSEINHDNN
ncbi:terminase small subunit [Leuconostoc mesenteroides]